MYIAYHPLYNHPVPENHRFPMEKYALLPQQLLYEGIASASNFHTPEVFTFSMHAQTNYPFEKEQSDKDIALPNGTDDKTYLDILRNILPQLIEAHQPDFVFYQAGEEGIPHNSPLFYEHTPKPLP